MQKGGRTDLPPSQATQPTTATQRGIYGGTQATRRCLPLPFVVLVLRCHFILSRIHHGSQVSERTRSQAIYGAFFCSFAPLFCRSRVAHSYSFISFYRTSDFSFRLMAIAKSLERCVVMMPFLTSSWKKQKMPLLPRVSERL